jgi:hypothetical protein
VRWLPSTQQPFSEQDYRRCCGAIAWQALTKGEEKADLKEIMEI